MLSFDLLYPPSHITFQRDGMLATAKGHYVIVTKCLLLFWLHCPKSLRRLGPSYPSSHIVFHRDDMYILFRDSQGKKTISTQCLTLVLLTACCPLVAKRAILGTGLTSAL